MKQPVTNNHSTTSEQELQLMITSLLGDELLAVEEIILDYSVSEVGSMQELISSVVQNRGKRLRPLLVLLSGYNLNKDRGVLRSAAAAVELIHTASLIHDDIIDGAEKRRGKPSLNSRYGNSAAVLAGDYFFARAFELVAHCESYAVTRLFTAAISTMCEGEIEQSRNAFNYHITEAQYLRCAYSKTAVLLESCCEAGALLAPLPHSDVQQLKHYGCNLGMAFQITDDLLDICGDSASTGKLVGNDLREGTITLPLIYVLEDPCWGVYLRELIQRHEFSPASLAFLKDPACQNGPLARARKQAAAYASRAAASLHALGESPAREILEIMVSSVLERKK